MRQRRQNSSLGVVRCMHFCSAADEKASGMLLSLVCWLWLSLLFIFPVRQKGWALLLVCSCVFASPLFMFRIFRRQHVILLRQFRSRNCVRGQLCRKAVTSCMRPCSRLVVIRAQQKMLGLSMQSQSFVGSSFKRPGASFNDGNTLCRVLTELEETIAPKREEFLHRRICQNHMAT